MSPLPPATRGSRASQAGACCRPRVLISRLTTDAVASARKASQCHRGKEQHTRFTPKRARSPRPAAELQHEETWEHAADPCATHCTAACSCDGLALRRMPCTSILMQAISPSGCCTARSRMRVGSPIPSHVASTNRHPGKHVLVIAGIVRSFALSKLCGPLQARPAWAGDPVASAASASVCNRQHGLHQQSDGGH
jgi:hypothetical protein